MTINIIDTIGETPVVRLSRLCDANFGTIFVKLEEFNSGGSIKARIALNMIDHAEKSGLLTPNSGQTIIEPTGGNTGLGLALVGTLRGYHVILTIPDNYSPQRIAICKRYGAEVILSDSSTGNDSHVRKAESILKKHPDYICLDQFKNPANYLAHYYFTAQEIIKVTNKVDCFISGIGSGGTITGIGKALKEVYPNVRVIAVQPEGCEVLKGIAKPHSIQGTALGFIPKILDVGIVDECVTITDEEVFNLFDILPKVEGIFVGLSACANICGAMKVARRYKHEDVIVTVAPDSGRNYI